jgi:nucleoside-diphosphate-sugar epimerase
MRQGEPEHARIVADYKCPDYKITLEEGIKETIEWYKTNIDKYTV